MNQNTFGGVLAGILNQWGKWNIDLWGGSDFTWQADPSENYFILLAHLLPVSVYHSDFCGQLFVKIAGGLFMGGFGTSSSSISWIGIQFTLFQQWFGDMEGVYFSTSFFRQMAMMIWQGTKPTMEIFNLGETCSWNIHFVCDFNDWELE